MLSHKCLIQNCNNEPSYNFIGESIPSYCSSHKKNEMIDFDKLRLNAKCCSNICNKPGYKYFNMNKQVWYCKECTDKHRINVNDKKCNHPECSIMFCGFAYYDEKYPILCDKHKLPDMVNLKSKRCLEPGCDKHIETTKNKLHKGYCSTCFHIKYPDEGCYKNNIIKERLIVNHIIKKISDYKFILNKCIGPKNHRPDVLLELDDRVIIIEIDENQHKWYNTDELLRLDIIQKAINKKVICIRFNPDNFIRDNVRTSSCFKLNDNEIFEIIKKDEFECRLKYLELI